MHCLLRGHWFDHIFDSAVRDFVKIIQCFLQYGGLSCFLHSFIGEVFAIVVNLLLATFNMIPIPPLDGSWVLYGLLPEPVPSWIDAVRPYGFMLLLVLVYLGALRVVLDPVIGFVVRLSQ